MLNIDLISIIIPTYNRAHLIGETLDSILAQTYTNWECIVVDDGSTDRSDDVIGNYVKQDTRFKYFKRLSNKPKGANACRNIGLEKAEGNYIVFFDSDDLMTPNHLEIKYQGIKTNNYDFVITRTKYFNADNKGIDSYYNFETEKVTAYNYITQKINWLTPDVLIKSKLAKKIRFNENIQSGQEYNYFSKLTLLSTHAKFIDEVVTLRRYHEGSIRANLKTNKDFNAAHFKALWFTYLDVRNGVDIKSRVYLLETCIKIIYSQKHMPIKTQRLFIQSVFKEFGFKAVYFILMLLSLKLANRGYFFKTKFFK